MTHRLLAALACGLLSLLYALVVDPSTRTLTFVGGGFLWALAATGLVGLVTLAVRRGRTRRGDGTAQ